MKTYTPEEAKTVRPCGACSWFGHDRNCSFCGGYRSPLTLSSVSGEDIFVIAKRGRDWPINLTTAVALLLCLLLPISASAGPLTLPALGLITMQAADLVSTERALSRPGAYEVNPIGQSTGTRLAMKAATTAGTLYLASKLGTNHPRLAQCFVYGVSAVIGAVALHNAQIGAR